MRKILLQIFSFSFIFMGIFALVRSLMVKNLTNESENSLMVYIVRGILKRTCNYP
ncbi:hypothetical protein LDW86_000933 [Campylobacter coli]|nr:hypothetical protein [Campylobacter coli]